MSFTRIAVSTVTIAALTFPALLASTTSLAVTPAPIAVDDLIYLDASYGAGPGGDTVLVGEVSVAALLLANDVNADEATNPVRFVMWSSPRRGDWGADDACRQSCEPYLQFPLVYYASPSDPDHRTDTFSYAIVDNDGEFSVATAVLVFNHTPRLANDTLLVDPLTGQTRQYGSKGGPVSTLPLLNDEAIYDRPLSVDLVENSGPGLDGTLDCATDSNPVVTITPDGSLFGSLGMDYTVTDVDGSMTTAEVGLLYEADIQDPAFSQPCIPDFDGDGLLDSHEGGRPTDPNVADSDLDGLSDFAELGTDPQDPDTDHDCFPDSMDSDDLAGPARLECGDAGPDPFACPGDGFPMETGDVLGPYPYDESPQELASFPNDDQVCAAAWVPALSTGFVPQGLALLPDGTALVSGYSKTSRKAKEHCAVVRLNLETGDALVPSPVLLGIPGCAHGGGVTQAPTGEVIIADTHELYVFEDIDALLSGGDYRTITLGKKNDKTFLASFLVDGYESGALWIGSFDNTLFGESRLYEISLSLILDPTTTRLSAPAPMLIPKSAQGAAWYDGLLYVASSTSTCGQLAVLSEAGERLDTYGWAPGVEEIIVTDAGLYAVHEAGSKAWPAEFFPVVALVDPFQLTEGPDCVILTPPR